MSVEVRHFRLFIAVAEELHFTRAAERLHLAQPALSAQISKLEKTLGLKLLERNTRRVLLTDEGREFLGRAKTAVQSYDEALAAAAVLRNGGAGKLTLGINPRIRSEIRMQVMNALARINPQVTVDFLSEGSVPLVDDVVQGRLHAALCVGPRSNGGFRSIIVRNDPLIVALRSDHRLAARESVHLRELREESWILPSSRVFGSNSLIQQHCVDAGFHMRRSPTTSDYDDDFTTVAAGHGIEVVPYSFTRTHAAPNVTFVPLRELTMPLHLIWMLESESPALSTLIRAVLAAEEGQDVNVRLGPQAASYGAS